MIREEDIYKVGTLTKTHGVNGEINFSFSDDVWDRADADYLLLRIDGLLVPFFIQEYRFRSDTMAIMKFEDIDNGETAQQYVGCEVFIERSLMPDDEQDDYTWESLIGFMISGVGQIKDIDDSTDNVLFVVATATGNEVLIPAVDELVEDIDWDTHTIRMTIPDGLLEL